MLTYKQDKKYWREWGEACRVQGWKGKERDAQRKAWHARLKLPESHTAWNNGHMNKWIHGTAHLRNAVDIRDRDRESVVWTIEGLQAAFKTLLGRDYARVIMIDFRDTGDLGNFPLEDPLQYHRDENGHVDPRDKDKLRDLVNLRNTLKNRLGRVIQRIKDGKLDPGPDCPAFHDRSQDEIIHCLLYKQPITPRPAVVLPAEPAPAPRPASRRSYAINETTTFQDRKGMEYGTADVAADGPSSPPAPSFKRPKAKTPPPAVQAPTAPVNEPKTGGKYCMH